MVTILRVVRPFGGYVAGEVISDAASVHEVLNGAHKHDVVRVAAPGAVAEKSKEA
jgi:hypothetical protein